MQLGVKNLEGDEGVELSKVEEKKENKTNVNKSSSSSSDSGNGDEKSEPFIGGR
jgi:hypothetical protein